MESQNKQANSAVPDDTKVLTAAGWKSVIDVPVGTSLAHPTGQPSVLAGVTPLGDQPVQDVVLHDGTRISCGAGQRLQIALHAPSRRVTQQMTAQEIRSALEAGITVRVVRDAAYTFGRGDDLPLDPWLLGVLLGDGYLRLNGIQLCNQQSEMYERVKAALPAGAVLRPLSVGARGTGSAMIAGEVRGVNPVAQALTALGLVGKRAHEKFIPEVYLQASLGDRLALLQGLMDTDGSADMHGRLEFCSTSLPLAEAVQELVLGLGGRTGFMHRKNVTFTSPQQVERKAARDAYRLTNMRLPEDIEVFRLSRKLKRLKPRTWSRMWTVTSVEHAVARPCVEVVVTAADGRWVGTGAAPFVTNQLQNGLGDQREAGLAA